MADRNNEEEANKRQRAANVFDRAGHATCDLSGLSHADLLKMVMQQQQEMKKQQQEMKKMKAQLTTKSQSKSSNKKKKEPRCKSMKPVENKAEHLDDLNFDEKEQALARIGLKNEVELTNARTLQLILFELGCNYCLQDHQFVAVRAMALGVARRDFPGQIDLNGASEQVNQVLKETPWRLSNKGFLIGDVMGLGKTVEAVAGAILRNAIAKANNKPPKPTLICTPNEAVLVQWIETLIKAGVEKKKVFRFQTKKADTFKGDIFVLCTIYDLQTEARFAFNVMKHESALFPTASKNLIQVLRNQYRAERGQCKARYRLKGEKVNACIRRHLAQNESKCTMIFRTFIFDEAHFARNLTTFWGCGAALIGLHAEAVFPMSGTPYNNKLQDIATLMAFINPRHGSARESWWKKATKDQKATSVQQSIKEWSESYLIRRGKDVIAQQLPPKEVTSVELSLTKTELDACEKWEKAILFSIAKLQKANSNKDRAKVKECLIKMLSQVANAMLAVAHPVLPSSGRDLTLFFSPTRSKMAAVVKAQEKRKACVFCYRQLNSKSRKNKTVGESLEEDSEDDNVDLLEEGYENVSGIDLGDNEAGSETETARKSAIEGLIPMKRKRKASQKIRDNGYSISVTQDKDDGDYEVSEDEIDGDHTLEHVIDSDNSDDDYNGQYDDEDDDDCLLFGDDWFEEGEERDVPEQGTGDILPIPACRCLTASMGLRHYACESCQEKFNQCPRCENFHSRLRESRRQGSSSDRIFCPETFGGFRASTKLKAVVSSFGKIPYDEKALIVSFYKGGLDLLERMFTDMFPDIDLARFDGDVGVEEREKQLTFFRTSRTCRILLMTVKTGGVGLNLVGANHVLFVDRNWNPMVLEQCEDRCYRIGQKKKVSIVYHDSKGTIDQVMATINVSKSTNAGIILADCPALTGNLTFIDTAGLLGGGLRELKKEREANKLEGKVTAGGSTQSSVSATRDLNKNLKKAPGTKKEDTYAEYCLNKKPQGKKGAQKNPVDFCSNDQDFLEGIQALENEYMLRLNLPDNNGQNEEMEDDEDAN